MQIVRKDVWLFDGVACWRSVDKSRERFIRFLRVTHLMNGWVWGQQCIYIMMINLTQFANLTTQFSGIDVWYILWVWGLLSSYAMCNLWIQEDWDLRPQPQGKKTCLIHLLIYYTIWKRKRCNSYLFSLVVYLCFLIIKIWLIIFLLININLIKNLKC